MNIPFIKISPGGNTTVLLDMPAPELPRRGALARDLMNPLHLGAEQVGFIDRGACPPRLDMMGGEFCGNAARAFAALLAMENHGALRYCAESDAFVGEIAVSGAFDPIPVRVTKQEHAVPSCPDWSSDAGYVYDASVRIAVGQHAESFMTTVESGIDVVRLEGITHVLLDTERFPMPSDHERASALLRERLGLQQEGAVGCIWYTRKADGLRIDPVVWVRETASTHYETGCGSGTLALGLLETVRSGREWEGNVLQPSGRCIRIGVTFSKEHGFAAAWIGGRVTLIARGETYV